MNIELTKNSKIRSTLRTLVIAGMACIVLPGCQSIDYKQAAYKALANEDCRRNQLETYCADTYSSDYYEYERMRNEFLRDTEKQIHPTGSASLWRTSNGPSIGS